MLNFNFRLFVFFSFFILSLFTSVAISEELTSGVIGEDSEYPNFVTDDHEIDEEITADDDFPPFPEEAEIEAEEDTSFFSFLDSPQKYLASGVEEMAKSMDRFFIADEIFYESSGSYLRLIHSTIFEEGGNRRSFSDVRFKLRLRETEKRFKLFFESSARDDSYNVTTQTESAPNTLGEEDDYVMGIQAESGEGFGWKYKPTIGAHLTSPIDTFVKFKFSREDKLGQWTVSWDETPYWQDSIGWAFDSSLVLNRKINEKNLFRSSTFAGWKNSTDQFDLSQVFAVFHTFNKRRAISFYTAAYGVSEPEIHTTEYLVGSIYRANIHKDYMFIEIEPQIRYQKINRFHPEHSIALRLELLFKK